jgi:hypothetical protein
VRNFLLIIVLSVISIYYTAELSPLTSYCSIQNQLLEIRKKQRAERFALKGTTDAEVQTLKQQLQKALQEKQALLVRFFLSVPVLYLYLNVHRRRFSSCRRAQRRRSR